MPEEGLVALDPTEVSAQVWAMLAPLLPVAKPGGRPRTVDRREVLAGRFSVRRRGGHWRRRPRTFGPWSTVEASCRRWRLAGVGERIPTA